MSHVGYKVVVRVVTFRGHFLRLSTVQQGDRDREKERISTYEYSARELRLQKCFVEHSRYTA